MAGFAQCLLMGILWMDGLFCLVVNRFFLPASEAEIDHWQHLWRIATQPLVWIFVTVLAGWVLEALWSTLREKRSANENQSV